MSATDKAKLDGYGINEAATCAMRTAPTDMLNINTDSPTSSTMYESIVATEDVTTLTNCPIYSGAFYAVRKVYWMSTDGANGYTHGKVLVELHEAWPVSGRIWTRTYNRDTGSWSKFWSNRSGIISMWTGLTYLVNGNGVTIPWSEFGVTWGVDSMYTYTWSFWYVRGEHTQSGILQFNYDQNLKAMVQFTDPGSLTLANLIRIDFTGSANGVHAVSYYANKYTDWAWTSDTTGGGYIYKIHLL